MGVVAGGIGLTVLLAMGIARKARNHESGPIQNSPLRFVCMLNGWGCNRKLASSRIIF